MSKKLSISGSVSAVLTIDGLPAVGVNLVDGDTAIFELPANSDGVHEIAVVAGSLENLQGTPIEPFTATVTVDTTAPRVIASSILEGDIASAATFIYTAQFDEPLDASSVDALDVQLIGEVSGPHQPVALEYDPADSTLSVKFVGLFRAYE